MDEIIKTSSPVRRICSGRFIDSTKLIYDAFTCFIKFKGWCPFKFENKTSAAKWQSMTY
jgi:hypothetical protein